MDKLTSLEMIEKARSILKPRELYLANRAGDVACALLSSSGNLFTEVWSMESQA